MYDELFLWHDGVWGWFWLAHHLVALGGAYFGDCGVVEVYNKKISANNKKAVPRGSLFCGVERLYIGCYLSTV